MADEDEIDILGDFSFDSCLGQNNQGIPSSSNDDTVHPQWLLDSTETNNWYDSQSKGSLQSLRNISGPSRKVLGDHTLRKSSSQPHTVWSHAERTTLELEMAKYGRNIGKIAQTLKSKTEGEIRAIIDAEFGVLLETATELENFEDHTDVPSVGQEEIVADYSQNIKKITPETEPFRKKIFNPKNSLLKSKLVNKTVLTESEIFYEDDLIIGSTESIGSELDMTDILSKNVAKQQAKVKVEKKIGNHRRKVSRNYDKVLKSKEILRSPQGRQRKDSSLSDESLKSPKMQIVLGSGLALPVSEGEQVIKIEKKNESEPESDIEIDVDSDNEKNVKKSKVKPDVKIEEPIAVPLRKFEPMPRRKKKINLDGGGGYTIMHTEGGDLYEVASEPRRERQPKKEPIHLIRCKVYNAEKPAPYEVHLHVSALILMDAHGHSSRGEVMGLLGGDLLEGRGQGQAGEGGGGRVLALRGYESAAAASSHTHCDMDPVSQAAAAARLWAVGLRVAGWHHSHPAFAPAPSRQDLLEQRALQRAMDHPVSSGQWPMDHPVNSGQWAMDHPVDSSEQRLPPLSLITSQHWPPGRTASQYRCLRVEEDDAEGEPVGYQLRVRLVQDIDSSSLPRLLGALAGLLRGGDGDPLRVAVEKDVCPHAHITYLEKCISSTSHHLRSAGYADDDPLVLQLVQGIRDIFR